MHSMEPPALDIFATKGTEYIFVVCFLLLLIFFWRFLYPPRKTDNSCPEESCAGGSGSIPDEESGGCSQPEETGILMEHSSDKRRTR
jgi:hypothetical protein